MLFTIKILRSNLRDLSPDRNLNYKVTYQCQFPKTFKILILSSQERRLSLKTILYSHVNLIILSSPSLGSASGTHVFYCELE